jgi:hypothetical protein
MSVIALPPSRETAAAESAPLLHWLIFTGVGLEPPLPYEAESFDAIYCISRTRSQSRDASRGGTQMKRDDQ